MSPHTIVARLGVSDAEIVVPGHAGAHVTEINFIDNYDRLEFGLGQALDQLDALGLVPGECAIDLTLVAATVVAADTRISREPMAQDGWTREIEISVPVAEPAVWMSGLLAS